MGCIGPCGLSLVPTYCQVQWPSSSETSVLACPCPQHVTGHSWGEKPPSTRAPVCSVPLGPGLGVVHCSPGPCPAFVVICAFDLCPPEPLIYTKDCGLKKKKKAVREKNLLHTRETPLGYQKIFQKNLPEWHNILKSDEIWKKKKNKTKQKKKLPTNHKYSIWQSHHSELKKTSKS